MLSAKCAHCPLFDTDGGISTKTPPVRFKIGALTVRGRIGRMGGENLLGLNKSVRATLGVGAGDSVGRTIEVGDQPRTVALPAVLASALDADPAVRAAFDALAPSMRKSTPDPSRKPSVRKPESVESLPSSKVFGISCDLPSFPGRRKQ